VLAQANAGRASSAAAGRGGQAIYVDLLPAFLKEKLEEARSGPCCLDPPLLGILWELLHDGTSSSDGASARAAGLQQETGAAMQRRMQPPAG
jgi:hypothetical protein